VGPNAVAFSPDGQMLVSTELAAVRRWDLRGGTPREMAPLKGEGSLTLCVAFAPAGRMLACGDETHVQLWDLSGWRPTQKANLWGGKEHSGPAGNHWSGVPTVAFSPDGKMLAAGTCVLGEGYIHLWSLRGRDPLKIATRGPFAEVTRAVAFSPTGDNLASADGKVVRLWQLGRMPPDERDVLLEHDEKVTTVVFSPDGVTLASADAAGKVIRWNAQSGQKVWECQLPGAVNHLAFAPDGSHLATANGNGTIYILRIPR
jgi:WD40 repeat protein